MPSHAPDPEAGLSGFLTSAEAADALGVKRTTLYSYASRGLVRIAPAPDGRRRMYLAADIEALRVRAAAAKGQAPAAASALDWGPPVLESAITSIDVDGPNYRGVPALTLAEDDADFEAVAQLLWGLPTPDRAPSFLARGLGVEATALSSLLPSPAPVSAVLSALVALLAADDPLRHVVTESAELSRARRLLRRMTVALMFVGPEPSSPARLEAALSTATLAEGVLIALGAPSTTPAELRLVHRALILCADHELNASSFAARVAAGTGADLYACVQAALAAWSGPRHGGASDRVEALLDELEGAPDLRVALGERLARGEPVPGIDHRLYPGGDPRARALLAWSAEVPGAAAAPRRALVDELVEALAPAGLPAANLDLGLVAVVHALGLPRGAASALFAIGRCAGWVAHAREQRDSGQLLRPRARYVGP